MENLPTYRSRTGRTERKETVAPVAPARVERDVVHADVREKRPAKPSFFKDRKERSGDRESYPQKRTSTRTERPYAPRKTEYGNRDAYPKKRTGTRTERPYAPRKTEYGDRDAYPQKRSSTRPERPYAPRRTDDDAAFAPKRKRVGEYSSERRTDSRSSDRPAGKTGYKARPYEKKYEPRKSASEFGAKPFASKTRAPYGSYKKRSPIPAAPSDTVRLNKFIANSGICSRREADEYITNGEIFVNGEIVTTLGTKVRPASDEIKFHDQRLSGEKKVYLLLNKPKGYITTSDDPHAKKTVMDLVKNACRERIYPVGRLDRETTGVLLFTNDGDLTKQLTHPSYNKRKVYHVFLDKNVAKEDIERLVQGVDLEDGLAAADEASYADERDDRTQIGLEIHSGKNRVVRRMFEALGYEVKRLDRVYFAGLTKKSVERGEWRMLTPKEVSMLKMGAYE
ncbi:pseudouridine synthase [Bacteroidia bacterium]|nr:pseudouridine synthase [Bacteroidia bacterium]